MNRIIFCTFLKEKSEGQDFQCYPGKIGEKIYNEISKKAWKKWIVQQTILINENKLNMSNVKDRKKLEKHMKLFLFKK
ncbi:oxidative damage protection protein [Buchnera aphidicola]|uniref:Probable Fe(2+)-trafficking protein n=1 Tax=Buchnera aphidicola str. USDA (Myzus persicae) TaxID=1009856 RepID=W0NZD6_BUCMP|nr:oxidative damage protection protein [Buchnera aphidicola]AHG59851.1 Yggx [Buchnera aphidicola str. USDA (Myzus persicae)]AHG60431.1 Yggx [Buchnera aphidicola str. W106 (Myzus persicae)]AHG61004.1 Yggx [Buchnera aphidicola str. G002 (Myzus persicae)]AHG61576.1 Yggx [Buchnera aphidicola str. F009 (Myzus persicae)]WAI02910.1 MAG: oxidative damage protection protein [Buchnera aphidicola (Myzus persicae)]